MVKDPDKPYDPTMAQRGLVSRKINHIVKRIDLKTCSQLLTIHKDQRKHQSLINLEQMCGKTYEYYYSLGTT